MTRFALLIVLLCAAITLAGPVPVQGGKKNTAPGRSAAAILEPVLRAESVGSVDRRQQLAEALQRQPDLSEARWQAGYLRVGKEWISFDDAGRTFPANGSLSAYREHRATAPRTAQGQLELADWCRANKLPDQERAHLSAALALDAGDEAAKITERIGYQQVAGQWLSLREIKGRLCVADLSNIGNYELFTFGEPKLMRSASTVCKVVKNHHLLNWLLTQEYQPNTQSLYQSMTLFL
jgi:hypothetical protein